MTLYPKVLEDVKEYPSPLHHKMASFLVEATIHWAWGIGRMKEGHPLEYHPDLSDPWTPKGLASLEFGSREEAVAFAEFINGLKIEDENDVLYAIRHDILKCAIPATIENKDGKWRLDFWFSKSGDCTDLYVRFDWVVQYPRRRRERLLRRKLERAKRKKKKPIS